MSQASMSNISTVLQGVALAILLWVGSSVQELKTGQAVYDYRLNQVESKVGINGKAQG